jgi:hypothetical protein
MSGQVSKVLTLPGESCGFLSPLYSMPRCEFPVLTQVLLEKGHSIPEVLKAFLRWTQDPTQAFLPWTSADYTAMLSKYVYLGVNDIRVQVHHPLSSVYTITHLLGALDHLLHLGHCVACQSQAEPQGWKSQRRRVKKAGPVSPECLSPSQN